MFTKSVRISCSFPACGGLVKYQTLHKSASRLLWSCLENTCHPFLLQDQDSASRQSVNTNLPYLKVNLPVVIITDLTWTLPVKTRSLPVFIRRVVNISTEQARNIQTSCKHKIVKPVTQQTV